MLLRHWIVFLKLKLALDGLLVLDGVVGVTLAYSLLVSDGDHFYEVILCHHIRNFIYIIL